MKIYSYIENVEKNSTDNVISVSKPGKIVYVFACPVGVAHTYIAAKKLEIGSKRQGYSIQVETHRVLLVLIIL
nr:hypothetical protein [Borrelia miyamotoi]